MVPEGLVAADDDGHQWLLGVAVSAPVGWLLRDGIPVDGYGDLSRVDEERARRTRAAAADRLADATLAEGDAAMAELLEWAKLGLPGDAVRVTAADTVEAWTRWWTAQGCRAAVPRAAHGAVLASLFGLVATGDGSAHLAPRLPAGWTAWRIERWRVGRSVLDVGLTRHGDLLRCRLLPRHGPPAVLTIAGGDRGAGGLLLDGEPHHAPAVRLELRTSTDLAWELA